MVTVEDYLDSKINPLVESVGKLAEAFNEGFHSVKTYPIISGPALQVRSLLQRAGYLGGGFENPHVFSDEMNAYYVGDHIAGQAVTGRAHPDRTPVGLVLHAAPVDATSMGYLLPLAVQAVEEGIEAAKPGEVDEKTIDELNKEVGDAIFEYHSKGYGQPSPKEPTETPTRATEITTRGEPSSYLCGTTDAFNTNCGNITNNYFRDDNREFLEYLKEALGQEKYGRILTEGEFRKELELYKGKLKVADMKNIGGD